MIFSHVMGVLKDNGGLFPELIPHVERLGFDTLMFNYNDIEPEEQYNKLARSTQLTLVNALQDEIMEFTNLKKVKYARTINTDGDHDFSNRFRSELITIIIRELK